MSKSLKARDSLAHVDGGSVAWQEWEGWKWYAGDSTALRAETGKISEANNE